MKEEPSSPQGPLGAPHSAAEVCPPGSVREGAVPGLGTPAFDPDELRTIDRIRGGIDLSDLGSVQAFGVPDQSRLSALGREMLTAIQLRNESKGWESLDLFRGLLRELAVSELTATTAEACVPVTGPYLESLGGFAARHERLWGSIEEALQRLQSDRRDMLERLQHVDELSDRYLRQLRRMDMFLVAGREFLRDAQRWTLPGLEVEAASWGDPLSGRNLEDYRQALVGFAGRLHELELTHMIGVQTVQQVRLVQRSDAKLREDLQTSFSASAPFWVAQVTGALSAYRDAVVGSEPGMADLGSLREADEALHAMLYQAEVLSEQAYAARRQAQDELLRMQTELGRRLAMVPK